MRVTRNLPCRADSDRGKLELFTPDGVGPFPVVVCIFGGGWIHGEKEIMEPYSRVLAEVNIASVNPNYRHTGTHCHPAQEEDISAVLDWVAGNAVVHGLDAQRIGLTGGSAGGHLCALVGLKTTRRPAWPSTAQRIISCRRINPRCLLRRSAGPAPRLRTHESEEM